MLKPVSCRVPQTADVAPMSNQSPVSLHERLLSKPARWQVDGRRAYTPDKDTTQLINYP